MVINRVSFFQKPVTQAEDFQLAIIDQGKKYSKDRGGFSGGIRSKDLQAALLTKMLPPPSSYYVIKRSEVLESHEQQLPKNPILNFFQKAESILTTALSCSRIR